MMKAKISTVWMYTAIAVFVLLMASCNSQGKKEREEERQERRIERQMPAGDVIETETVVVEVDSLIPDSAAVGKQ